MKHFDADTLRECRCGLMPNGDLTILREYQCGCIVYLDQDGKEFTEQGLFCEPSDHAIRLTRGQETQPSLFQ